MPIDLSRARELFLAALDLPLHERATYLDSACGDPELRRRIEAMLKAQEASGELLPRPPAEMLAGDSATQAEEALAFLTPPQQPDSLGRLGHYEVRGIIGKGGFGVVLKAFDDRLHRVVAIKVLAPAYAASAPARKRFIREARAAAAVKNEHVVAIHDVQEAADPPYLVMELIDGISLQDKLDRTAPLGLKEILRIGMQMAEGLAAAHKQGLVHRDIKPANILLENGVERVKITDFGLARAVDDASLTQSGTVAGTPMFMSPQQAEGLPVDHRSDLFSLGSVLYTMATGHPPFRGSGTHAVLKRVIDASPRPIREVNDEVPDFLSDIIARLHAKKPEDRFQAAQEVAELLGARLADVQAGRATPSSPRRRAPSRAAGIAILAVLVGVAWWLHPHLLLAISNSGRLWISGKNAADVQWALSRGGEMVKEFKGLGFQGFDAPPGDYVLKATNLKPGTSIHFDLKKAGFLSGAAEWKDADQLSFAVVRGESVNIEATWIDPGWVQLFNGRDLRGWKSIRGKPAGWTVESGDLVGRSPPDSYLFSDSGRYGDFHLRAEVSLNAAGNSGVLFRTSFEDFCPDVPPGYEADLSFVEGTPSSPIGTLWKDGKRVQRALRSGAAPGQWVTLEVIARGPRLQVVVNGQTVADFASAAGRRKGHIALQALEGNTVVRFRKIAIKELSAE